MERLKFFFWFCSGAHLSILRRCPTEHNKYAGIGGTVFFTGLFASLSGAYALYFIFNDSGFWQRISAAVGFGLLWGAMIFNLDRYIVASMKKNGGMLSELRMALPRFVLAAGIAFVISKPLELQIFHTSIQYELDIMKQEELQRQEQTVGRRFEAGILEVRNQINQLQAGIDQKKDLRNRLDEEARKEADGTGGSEKRGAKTIYKLKKADAEKAQAELDSAIRKNQPEIEKQKQIIIRKQQVMDSLKSTIRQGSFDGFDKQLDALGRVSAQSATIAWASWFIMFLFLSIETAPILVKLLSARGPYDDLLEKHEHGIEIFKIQEMSKMNQRTNDLIRKLTGEIE